MFDCDILSFDTDIKHLRTFDHLNVKVLTPEALAKASKGFKNSYNFLNNFSSQTDGWCFAEALPKVKLCTLASADRFVQLESDSADVEV